MIEENKFESFFKGVCAISFLLVFITIIYCIWFPIHSNTPFKIIGTCVVVFFLSAILAKPKQ